MVTNRVKLSVIGGAIAALVGLDVYQRSAVSLAPVGLLASRAAVVAISDDEKLDAEGAVRDILLAGASAGRLIHRPSVAHIGIFYGQRRQAGTDHAAAVAQIMDIARVWADGGRETAVPGLVHLGDDEILAVVAEVERIGTSDHGGTFDLGTQLGVRRQAGQSTALALRETGDWLVRYYGGENPWGSALPPPGAALPSLRVSGSGHWFATDAGLFDYREVTFFAAQSRMLRGEGESAVRPVLRAYRAIGFTATRVLLTLGGDYWTNPNSPGGAAHAIGYSLASDPAMPGYWEQLDALVAMHAAEGLYVRLTIFGALEPFGYVWDPIRRQDGFHGEVQRKGTEFALAVAQRYANASNVLLELANEPVGIGFKDSSEKLRRLGCDVQAIAPTRLLTAGDINDMVFEAFFDRCFDFVDRHVDRTPDLEFFAAMKRMGEDAYRDAQPRIVPAVSGEPVNFGESRLDGRTGDVATSPAVAYAYGAVTRSRQILPNFHYDGGLYSTMPKPETVVLMRAFHQALNAFPMLEGNRWRGHHSVAQGNYWSTRPYPEHDDARTVADHVNGGYGPWRVFGLGDYSVAFPFRPSWPWSSHLTAPADLIDRYSSGGYDVAIVRRH